MGSWDTARVLCDHQKGHRGFREKSKKLTWSFTIWRRFKGRIIGEMIVLGDFQLEIKAHALLGRLYSVASALFGMSDADEVLLSGWLKKKGDKGLIKGWKNRWFQVRFEILRFRTSMVAL